MATEIPPGDLLQIDLGSSYHSYARKLKGPYLAFYNVRTSDKLSPREIISNEVLFVLLVQNATVNKLKKVGRIPENVEEMHVPDQFIQDLFDSSKIQIIDRNSNIRPASYREVVGLERVVAWSDKSIVERLNAHFDGRPSKTQQMYELKKPNSN